jgi:hypothetical protein
MSTSPDDSRLAVPGYTILILFLTLAILIPLVSYRMAQSLVTPPVTELIDAANTDPNLRSWRSGIWKYTVNLTPRIAGTAETPEIPGALSVTFAQMGTEGEADLPEKSYTIAVDFDADRLRDVIFLDSDGDGCHNLVVWGDRSEPQETHSVVGFDLVQTPETEIPWEVTTFDLSRIPGHLAAGYAGGDLIERQSELLVRRFPVLAEGAPEGTEMSMIWDFRLGYWRKDPRSK